MPFRRRTHLKIDELAEAAKRPRVFGTTNSPFWSDPYISRHILNAHLDPTTDDATRRPPYIELGVEWMDDTIRRYAQHPFSLLDLGCGPGMYCEAFAREGYAVTGIDFSPASIAHARRSARSAGLTIAYQEQDIRSARFPTGLAAVVMVYGVFGTHNPSETRKLLKKIRASLRPDGVFICDVFTRRYTEREKASGWYARKRSGFWSAGPHVVLESAHRYPREDAHLDRYVVITADGTHTVYDEWKQCYTTETITTVLEEGGFTVRSVAGSLTGGPVPADPDWIAVAATPNGKTNGKNR